MGPTLVSYLCGARARVVGTVVVTIAEAAVGMVGALWLAATTAVGAIVAAVVVAAGTATTVGAAAATATTVGAAAATVGAAAAAMGAAATAMVGVGSGLGLDPPTGGGEEWRTRGLKLCHPCVFTMPGPEKRRRWGSGGRRI